MVLPGEDTASDTPGGTLPSNPTAAGVRSASRLQIHILGGGLIVFALLLASLFLSFWPSEFTLDTTGNQPHPVRLFGSETSFEVSADVRLLIVVMLAGGLGSFIHTATSFGDFVGNEKLTRSWLWWYILKPFIGMILALIFYLVLRAGFLSAGTEVGKLNVYGITALAGLSGMFSKQATDKLSEVFNSLFRTAPEGGDSKRGDDLSHLVPVLTAINPTTIKTATQDAVVEVKGSHFAQGSVVRVNGKNRETQFKSGSELVAKLLPDDVANEGTLEIVVFSPAPGGGTSTPLPIQVTS